MCNFMGKTIYLYVFKTFFKDLYATDRGFSTSPNFRFLTRFAKFNHFAISAFIEGQTNSSVIVSIEDFEPGCDTIYNSKLFYAEFLRMRGSITGIE